MEPWKRPHPRCPTRRSRSFNGATAMEPWKSALPRRQPIQYRALQWGHGDGAVEEPDRLARAVPGRVASMGPRRWSRGRGPRMSRSRANRESFNGATAMEPWKRSCCRTSGPSRGSRFNGATAMEPWKSADSARAPGRDEAASMGPRRWSRGREPALRTVWSKGLRTGFARGSTRGGVKPIASSGDEVVKSKGNGAWAQREAPARCFRANILIAKELWRECGLIHISAPHRSQVKG